MPPEPSDHPPSLWAATAPPAPETAPFAGDARTDVAIVGAGFTGLSAALRLAEQGVATTVLEAHAIGWGASGRNNGQVIPNLSRLDPDAIVAAVPAALGGTEKGEAFVALIRDSATMVFDLIRRHGMAAEAVQNGWVQPAHRPSRMRLAESRVRQWGDRGAAVRLLDRDQMAAIAGSDHWFGGWENASGGRINPLGFARGLARAAIGAGAAIHTDSPVLGIARDATGWVLQTAAGRLRAERVVLATNAYTPPGLWPGLARTVVPVRSYQLATAPLSDNVRKSVLPGGHALSDTRGDLYFFRFDADGRLVTGGGLLLPLGWSGRVAQRVRARIAAVFPQVGDVPFEHAWWGHVGATADRLPHVYELAPGVLAWTGCNGRGVALSVALGRELAAASAGVPLRDLAVPVERQARPIPGHAFRSLGVAWTVAANRLRDARD